MLLTLYIDDEHLQNALAGAHSAYWAHLEPRATFDKRRFLRAALDGKLPHNVLGRLRSGLTDGTDGDIILQLGCFGEVRYG